MSPPVDESLVTVGSAELGSVALTIVDAPDLATSSNERFFGQVRAIAEGRARKDWPNEGEAPLAVFIRSDYPREAAQSLALSVPTADLIVSTDPILGRVHVLNFDASQGRSAGLPSQNAGEVVEWLAQHSFSSDQIVIVYRDSLQLIERGRGVDGGMTRKEPIRTEQPEVSEAELLKALGVFHEREVLTPSICSKDVWKSKHAANYHPGPEPERAIQRQLKTFLVSWWHGLIRVALEDSIDIGRIDIRLLRPVQGAKELSYWSIIELKVVKSFRSSKNVHGPATVSDKENAEAVAKGVEQAAAFARDRGCFGVLEVYDMRKVKSPDPRGHAVVVQALADHHPNPTIRVTPIFGSSDDARHAGYG